MINKRLIGMVGQSKKYIAGNVALQWCSLAANIAMMTAITGLLAALFTKTVNIGRVWMTVAVAAGVVVVRFFCTIGSSRMSYLSSKAVKDLAGKNLRQIAALGRVL